MTKPSKIQSTLRPLLFATAFCFSASHILLAQTDNLRFQRLSIEEGLSQVTVRCMLQDKFGFMWFGSMDGLNKYDGYTFEIYKNDPDDPTTISGNVIYALLEDRQGVLWIGTTDGGLNRFDRENDLFQRFRHDEANPDSLSSSNVYSLLEDRAGRLWIGTSGGLNRYDPAENRFRSWPIKVVGEDGPSRLVHAICQDRSGRIWLGVESGLLFFDPANPGRFERFDLDSESGSRTSSRPLQPEVHAVYEDRSGMIWVGTTGSGLIKIDPNQANAQVAYKNDPGDPFSLNKNDVWSIVEDRSGGFWVGSLGGGLEKMDRASGRFLHHRHDPTNPQSLSHNQVISLYEDRSGVFWAGTFGAGLNKYSRGNDHFVHYRHEPENPNSLSHDVVMSLFEDRSGRIWIGMEGHGLDQFNRRTETFVHFRHDPANPGSLSHNDVSAIQADSFGVLWVGASGGLNRFNEASQSFDHYFHDPGDPNSLGANRIRVIHEDRRKNLWIGTTGGGLNLLNRPEMNFTRYQHNVNDPHSMSGDRVWAVCDEKSGKLWVGTWHGLNLFDPDTGRAIRFVQDESTPHGLSSDLVLSLLEDRDGVLWVGTMGGGLNRFEREKGVFRRYLEKDGLPNTTIYGILQDKTGLLWISSNKGVSRFNPREEVFKNFTVEHGLQSNEFNAGAAFRNELSDEMFFGGVKGLNSFFPAQIREDPIPPDVVLTEFLVFNQRVRPRAVQPNSQLKRHINQATDLVLSYQDYLISFEFAALHYADPAKNQYAYMLEGLDKDWIYTDASKRFATYTNLSAGSYTFRVRGSNPDGVWSREETSIRLRVQPAPWRAWWAYVLYALAFAMILAIYLRNQTRKVEKERALASKERLVSHRLRQVDKLKDEFLANTSHELRTPLNGMIGLAQSMRDGVAGPFSDKTLHMLNLMISSGKRLTRLVDDILDFSKLKNRSLELELGAVDLNTMVEVVITLSKPLIGKKKLDLINETPEDIPVVIGDENRLQQIMHNLVDNAIKHTDSGSIKIGAEVIDDWVFVRVEDSGVGIAEEMVESIFESFEQVDGSMERGHGGAGLGLAIARQLVVLHGGKIWVESVLGEGSRFFFSLPVMKDARNLPKPRGKQVDPVQHFYADPKKNVSSGEAATSDPESDPEKLDRRHIMIVDDEPVNRQVLANYLSLEQYRVTEVDNGIDALKMIEAGCLIDLMLVDIMMPRMSGYEVCRRLRKQYSVHELPIIFLSAKSQVGDLVAGFEVGANDYLTKPITREELLSRVKTHIQLLAFNRTLEQKVEKRTLALHAKNEELARINKKLWNANRILEEVSLTDPLTGLVNRRYLDKYLEKDVAMVRRVYEDWLSDRTGLTARNADLVFLLLDLDHFKHINDSHGHAAGDQVLIQIKEIMEKVSRDLDILARWGGEEFLIVSRNVNRGQGEVLAERLRQAVLSHPFSVDGGKNVRITCSIGFACYPFIVDEPGPITWRQVIGIADLALYAAKNAGRNCWVGVYSTELAQANDIIRELHGDMQACLDRGLIHVTTSVAQERLVWL